MPKNVPNDLKYEDLPASAVSVGIPARLKRREVSVRPNMEFMRKAYSALRNAGIRHAQATRTLGYTSVAGESLEAGYVATWAKQHLEEARENILAYARGESINHVMPPARVIYEANCRIQDLAGETPTIKTSTESRSLEVSLTGSEVIEIEERIRRHLGDLRGVRQVAGGVG